MRFFSPTAEFTVRDGETRVRRLEDFSTHYLTSQRLLKSPGDPDLELLVAYFSASISSWEVQSGQIASFRRKLTEAGFSVSRERVFVSERECLLVHNRGLKPVSFLCRCGIALPEEATSLIQEICQAYEARLGYEPGHWQSRNGNYAWHVERTYLDLFTARCEFNALVASLAELAVHKRLDFSLYYVIHDVDPQNEDQKWLAPR